MARKVKFPFDLKDGYQARSNIEEVRAHFDIEKIIAQFHNGKLKIWLEDHYLPAEAEQVGALDGNAPDLAAQLCTILGVEGVATENVDSSLIQKREEKRQRLSQYTTNPILCDMAEFAAFDQADLDALIEEGVKEIILCNERFRIPLLAENRTYYGVGKAVSVIESDTPIEFAAREIRFVDIPFDEKYMEILENKKERERINERREKTKACITPDVLAELCSVLMLGKLKYGDYLWRDQRSWANGFYYETHSRMPRMSPSFQEKIKSRKEVVLGYGNRDSFLDGVDIMLFTDKRLYLADKDTSIDVSYSDIEDVTYQKFQKETGGFFRIYTSEGKIHELYRVSDWSPRVRLDILRLFLLLMARLFGYCKYSFAERELAILKQATLRSLEHKSITEFL